jgi:hypothetical protein
VIQRFQPIFHIVSAPGYRGQYIPVRNFLLNLQADFEIPTSRNQRARASGEFLNFLKI